MTSVVVTNPDAGGAEEEDDVQFDIRMDTSKYKVGHTVVKKKGRGHKTEEQDDRYAGRGGDFEAVGQDETVDTEAQKSVEGWIVVATGIHEEAQESDVHDLFADCGEIKQLHLNLDRRTGFVKGYALIEYEHFKEAQKAIDTLNGTQLLDQDIHVDWAFKKPNKGPRRVERRRR